MKKSRVIIIIVITICCLVGFIVTQVVWVDHAIGLRTKQFNNAVYNGLVSVTDEVCDIRRDAVYYAQIKQKGDSVIHLQDVHLDYVILLDSLIKDAFGCLRIREGYDWAVVDTINESIVLGRYVEKYKDALIHSEHQFSASDVFSGTQGYCLKIYFPEQKKLILRKMFLWILILSAAFLIVVVITIMIFIHTIWRQKKLSEMKNDFINNMTHEFKTPISTISVASEILMKPSVCQSPEKTLRYANIIFDENLRLRNQVEQVLHISVLDKNDFKLKMSKIDIHKIIENSIDTFNVILKEKKGMILADLYATKTELIADEVHIINLLSNLLDNAVKYSLDAPEIRILTRDAENGIEIIISDKGVGMSSEDLKHIFKKFYRVHTGDRHDVKGFGLGLFYVKTVIDAHQGRIKVKSELKKGSTFEIYLPYNSSSLSHD